MNLFETHAHFKLVSPDFAPKDAIPEQFTCDGSDISPPLSWEGAPEGTQSFALVVDDPDAGNTIWVHWVVFNIPGHTQHIEADRLPKGATAGMNDFGKTEWGGPCPPEGEHRYYFRLYALDTELDLSEGASRSDVDSAMDGHIIAAAELMGKYERPRREET